MIDFVLDDSEAILTYAEAADQPAVFTLDDRAVVAKYSEDQPRDDHGRWTDAGGGDAGPRAGLNDLVATISKPDGGFTYSAVTGKQPKHGFVVSVYKGREGVFDTKDLTATKLFEYASKNWDLLKQPGNYLGGWHNPDDDKVYLDVSRVVESADEAAKLAKDHNQLAYFDLGSGTSIPTARGKEYGLETVTASHWLARGRPDTGGDLRVVSEPDGEGADGGGQGEGARAARSAEVKFDPDQPRDEQGRWTDTGAGDSAASWPAQPLPTKHADPIAATKTTFASALRKAGYDVSANVTPMRLKDMAHLEYFVMPQGATAVYNPKTDRLGLSDEVIEQIRNGEGEGLATALHELLHGASRLRQSDYRVEGGAAALEEAAVNAASRLATNKIFGVDVGPERGTYSKITESLTSAVGKAFGADDDRALKFYRELLRIPTQSKRIEFFTKELNGANWPWGTWLTAPRMDVSEPVTKDLTELLALEALAASTRAEVDRLANLTTDPDIANVLAKKLIALDGTKALKYSDDQPRDDHGRWTDSGAGDGRSDPRGIVERLRARAEDPEYRAIVITTEPMRTRFLLPDGTRIGYESDGRVDPRGSRDVEHNDALYGAIRERVGDAMAAGVVRYSPGEWGGVQFAGVLSEEQAATIADDWNFHYRAAVRVDAVGIKDGRADWDAFVSAVFPSPISADRLRNWSKNPKPLKSKIRRAAKYSDEQPRVPAGEPDGGQWTDGGAGGGEDTSEAAVTERELGKQAEAGIAKIDSLVGKALAEADFSGSGEGDPDSDDGDWEASWSDFSGTEQNEVYDKWREEQYGGDDYWEAGAEAERVAIDESIRDDQDEIAEEATDKVLESIAGKLTEDAPLLGEGEKLTLTLDKDTVIFEELAYSYSGADKEIPAIDRDALRTVSGKELTDAQKDLVEEAWKDGWQDAREEYIQNGRDNGKWSEAESMAIDEAINDAWSNMSDHAKYEFAVNNDFIPENMASGTPGDVSPGLPTTWKWEAGDDHEADEDYIRTRIISNKLTELRTNELLKERGVEHGTYYDINGEKRQSPSIDGSRIAETVWDQWKSSSTADLSLAVQLATARELGGVHRLTDEEVSRAIRAAGTAIGGGSYHMGPDMEGPMGQLGMERLQAYVRAQWETSQYVLSKTGTDRVDVYRGLMIESSRLEGVARNFVDTGDKDLPPNWRQYTQLPDIKLQRGGLQSTTMAREVANSWNGINWRGQGERVVLRLSVPRTSVLSLPVFGKNVKSEREVVVAGTKGKWKWDAWLKRAPDFKAYQIKMARKAKGATLVIDLTDEDRGKPHWLTGANSKKEFDPDQPRDERGRWTDTGGAASESDGPKWSQDTDAGGRPVPIKVATVEEAVQHVLDGKVVELPDVRSANTLIAKLAAIAQEAKAAGEEAKHYDLCNVSVKGSNLFCAEKVRTEEHPEGIPRIQMPQLAGEPVPGTPAADLPRAPYSPNEVDTSERFMQHLEKMGVAVTLDIEPAAKLKASQRELVGPKVAAMMVNDKFDPANAPLFISRDNYVIDGHHRWAAVVGRDAADNKLGDLKMRVLRIDMPITEVLHMANWWTRKFGIKPVGVKTVLDLMFEKLMRAQDDRKAAAPGSSEHVGGEPPRD